MGLFSFLSRKTSYDQKKLASLKAQPYNATVASLAPVQGIVRPCLARASLMGSDVSLPGTYPVAGNGPDVLGARNGGRPQFSNKVYEPPAPADLATPPPFVSAFGGHDVERPRTAPSRDGTAKSWSTRSRTSSFKGPPVSLHSIGSASRIGIDRPPYRLPNKHPNQDRPRPPYRLPDKAPDRPASTQPSLASLHKRSSWIRSGDGGTMGGFVDLLDAQSTLSPTDFHQRVRAAGIRNYGEDVADRNISQNSFRLTSVSSFTSLPSRSDAVPSTPVGRDVTEQDTDSHPNAKKRLSFGVNSRPRPLASGSTGAPSEPLGTQMPVIPPRLASADPSATASLSPTKSAQRRKSMPLQLVASFTSRSRSNSASKQPEYRPEIDHFPEELRSRGGNMARSSGNEISGQRSGTPVSSSRLAAFYKPRDSVVLAKKRAEQASPQRSAAPSQPRPEGFPRRDTVSHSKTPGSMNLPSKRLSLQNLPPSHSHKKSYDSSSAEHQAATRSFTSLPNPNNKRLDIEDLIPERSASRRKWSMDSTTATLSSSASNSQRPQSRHTANTSVDMMPYVKGANPSLETLDSPTYQTALESQSRISQYLAADSTHDGRPSSEFNIDDYLSSDDDWASPKLPRGSGEEDLVFSNSGYGVGGVELPGLSGPLDFTAQRPTAYHLPNRGAPRHRQEDSLHFPGFSSKAKELRISGVGGPFAESWDDPIARYSNARPSKGGAPARNGTAYSEPEDEGDDTEEELCFDIPMKRREPAQFPLPRNDHRTGRRDVIEEEKDTEEDDFSNVYRLRKESKSQERPRALPGRKRSETVKGKEIAHRNLVVTGGSDADIE